MRTVYLGTSEFAAGVLARLAASPHRPSLVVTRPDRPRGRGRRLRPPPVAEAAAALGLPAFQPEDVNGEHPRGRIAAERPDVLCLCAFGALIGRALLAAHETLNVHPSLLPRWRGAAPIERAIMAGDPVTGVSIMRVVAELDAGPVCLAEREPIAADDTYGTLAPRLAGLGGELLVRALDLRPPCAEQAAAGVTYAEKIGPEDRRLRPEREPAAALERRVRALTPHIGAWLEQPGGRRLGVRRVAVLDCGPPPGRLAAAGDRLRLGCATGALALLEVQPEGGRPMAAADFLRGHGLGP